MKFAKTITRAKGTRPLMTSWFVEDPWLESPSRPRSSGSPPQLQLQKSEGIGSLRNYQHQQQHHRIIIHTFSLLKTLSSPLSSAISSWKIKCMHIGQTIQDWEIHTWVIFSLKTLTISHRFVWPPTGFWVLHSWSPCTSESGGTSISPTGLRLCSLCRQLDSQCFPFF